MSRDTLSILKRHLQEKKHSVVLNIIQEHLYFDMYEGVARNKQQIEATAGAVVGEATRQGEWSSGLTDGSKHCVCANYKVLSFALCVTPVQFPAICDVLNCVPQAYDFYIPVD